MKFASLFLIILSVGVYAADQSWQTKSRCGEQEVIYSVSCKATAREDELNQCESRSQSLDFAKVKLALPFFSKNELAQYRKAGTADDLFVKSWACVEYEGQHYLRLHYGSYGGHGEFDEKEDYFTSNGVVERTTATRDLISKLERRYFKYVDTGDRQFELGKVYGRFQKK